MQERKARDGGRNTTSFMAANTAVPPQKIASPRRQQHRTAMLQQKGRHERWRFEQKPKPLQGWVPINHQSSKGSLLDTEARDMTSNQVASKSVTTHQPARHPVAPECAGTPCWWCGCE